MGTGEGRRDCRASTMERPERRMGTRQTLEGVMVWVLYS